MLSPDPLKCSYFNYPDELIKAEEFALCKSMSHSKPNSRNILQAYFEMIQSVTENVILEHIKYFRSLNRTSGDYHAQLSQHKTELQKMKDQRDTKEAMDEGN